MHIFLGQHGVSELHQDPGFSCGCGLELAVMVKHFLDYRNARLAQQTFWEEVKDKLLVVLKIVSESSPSSSNSPTAIPPGPSTLLYPPPLVSTLQLPHVWWVFLIFTKLHTYDTEGRKVTNNVVSVKYSCLLYVITFLHMQVYECKGTNFFHMGAE